MLRENYTIYMCFSQNHENHQSKTKLKYKKRILTS